jgi:23S rRNA (pseudouridine1915-N3)-methyltransferase
VGLWRRADAATDDHLKLHIVARGKIGRCAEADLIERYAKRISWPFAITELPESGGKQPPAAAGMIVVALDETGEHLSSLAFARKVEVWRDAGTRELRFLIGAADGLTADESASAHTTIAFGKATWPHMLARAMLVEQLYRVTSIIAGHPYHREG